MSYSSNTQPVAFSSVNPLNHASAPDISLLKNDVRVVQPFEVVFDSDEADYDGEPRRVVYRAANQDPATAEGRSMVQDELAAVAASTATAKKDQAGLKNAIDCVNTKYAGVRSEPDFTVPAHFGAAVKPAAGPTPSNHYSPNEFKKHTEPHQEYEVSEYKCTDYEVSEYKSVYE